MAKRRKQPLPRPAAKPAEAVKPSKAKSLVAAAARFVERRFSNPYRANPSQGWQQQAWDLYDTTPEMRFAAGWVANAMSKARLIAARRGPDGAIEHAPADHPATQLVAEIAGGPTGQSQLLSDFGPHLVIAGEGWIVIQPQLNDLGQPVGQRWMVLSVLELTQPRGTNSLVAEIDGEQVTIPGWDPDTDADPTAPVAIRVWHPHPRRYIEADSPIRSSLSLLEQLRMLDAAITAVAKSRLLGRGVLLVPQGTRFPTPPGQAGAAEDDLLEVFLQVAETAYRDPDSAAATVPIILEVPSDQIAHIQRLTFESDFDQLAVQLREELIKRFATSLDTPAEVLLGMSSVNHWGQWALQEEAVRLAVEPRLALIADALTTQWLHPLLQDQRVPDADEWMVWYDTSALRVRSNRAETALQMFDRGAISAQALRRETGFDESDAPNTDTTSPPPPPPGYQPPPPPAPILPVDESPRLPDTQHQPAPHLEGGPL